MAPKTKEKMSVVATKTVEMVAKARKALLTGWKRRGRTRCELSTSDVRRNERVGKLD